MMEQRRDAEILVFAVRGRKLPVIKIVQELTGLGLPDAVGLVNHPPFILRVPVGQVEGLCEQLGAADAGVMQRKSPVPPTDEFTDIERLGRLHDRGVLSDSEFAAAKTVLLSRI
jgi:Short C-terminal domain/Ribosomal protein L7/L12 C-terminal domain